MLKKLFIFIAVTCAFSCASENKWKLVWSDEFEYTGLPDPKKWTAETGGHGWGNNELEFYT